MKLADKLAKAAGKMSPRKLILLCAFFALMIFIILYSTLSSFEDNKEEKTPEVAGVAVIEAATDISPRTVITDDMLKASVVPESLLPPGALTDKKLIVGHKAGVTILAGDVVTRRKLDVSAAAGFQVPDKWVHLRKSNTEPIIRVYSEASTMEQADELGKKLMQVVYDMQ